MSHSSVSRPRGLCACMGASVCMCEDWGDFSTSCPHKTLSNPPLMELIGSSYSIWTQLCSMTRSRTETNTKSVIPLRAEATRRPGEECHCGTHTHTHAHTHTQERLLITATQSEGRERVIRMNWTASLAASYSSSLSIRKSVFNKVGAYQWGKKWSEISETWHECLSMDYKLLC